MDYKNLVINETFLLLFAIIFSIFFLFIIFVIIFKNKTKKNNEIAYQNILRSDFIFNIDFKSLTVDYFVLNDLKKITTISFNEFLDFFYEGEQNKVKNFVSSFMSPRDNDNLDDYVFITNAYPKNYTKAKLFRAALVVKGIDLENKVLTLVGVRLINTPCVIKAGRKNPRNDVFDISEIRKFYDDKKFSNGFFAYIKLVLKKDAIPFMSRILTQHLLVDSLYAQMKPNVPYFFINSDDDEIGLLNTHKINNNQLAILTKNIKHCCNGFLEKNGLTKIYDCYICCASNNDLKSSFDESFKKVKTLLENGISTERYVSIYFEGNKKTSNVALIYEREAKRIIENQEYYVLYTPIVHLTSKRTTIHGYFTEFRINSKIFMGITKFLNICSQMDATNKFYAGILPKTIKDYVKQLSGISSPKLYLKVSFDHLNEILPSIDSIQKHDDLKIYFVLRSYEFKDKAKNVEIKNSILKFKQLGYYFALQIKEEDTILADENYKIFNSYIFDMPLESSIKVDSRTFIKGQSLLRKLTEYGKPIISTLATSIQSMQDLTKIGVSYFINDIIGKPSATLNEIDPKIIKKLTINKK